MADEVTILHNARDTSCAPGNLIYMERGGMEELCHVAPGTILGTSKIAVSKTDKTLLSRV